jgi:hypothetical protein
MNKIELLNSMKNAFSTEEIREVCIELGIDYENLGGEGKGAKIRELIQYLERRGRLNELVAIYHRERPDAGRSGSSTKPSDSKITVLFLAADPSDASRLRLGEEHREIQEKLQLAKLRDRIVLQQRMSVRPADISQALLDTEASVVHFSGHGMSTGELCFENQVGRLQPVDPEALAALFEQFSGQVKCVMLNACYSEIQTNAIVRHIECVVGMNLVITDSVDLARHRSSSHKRVNSPANYRRSACR